MQVSSVIADARLTCVYLLCYKRALLLAERRHVAVVLLVRRASRATLRAAKSELYPRSHVNFWLAGLIPNIPAVLAFLLAMVMGFISMSGMYALFSALLAGWFYFANIVAVAEQ